MAQLVEWLHLIPEVSGSNQVIGKNLFYILNICLLLNVCWRDENKEKEAGNGPFLKKIDNIYLQHSYHVVTYGWIRSNRYNIPKKLFHQSGYLGFGSS